MQTTIDATRHTGLLIKRDLASHWIVNELLFNVTSVCWRELVEERVKLVKSVILDHFRELFIFQIDMTERRARL